LIIKLESLKKYKAFQKQTKIVLLWQTFTQDSITSYVV